MFFLPFNRKNTPFENLKMNINHKQNQLGNTAALT